MRARAWQRGGGRTAGTGQLLQGKGRLRPKAHTTTTLKAKGRGAGTPVGPRPSHTPHPSPPGHPACPLSLPDGPREPSPFLCVLRRRRAPSRQATSSTTSDKSRTSSTASDKASDCDTQATSSRPATRRHYSGDASRRGKRQRQGKRQGKRQVPSDKCRPRRVARQPNGTPLLALTVVPSAPLLRHALVEESDSDQASDKYPKYQETSSNGSSSNGTSSNRTSSNESRQGTSTDGQVSTQAGWGRRATTRSRQHRGETKADPKQADRGETKADPRQRGRDRQEGGGGGRRNA